MLNSAPKQGKVKPDLNAFSTSKNIDPEHQADVVDRDDDLILNDNEVLDADPLEDIDDDLTKQYVPLST
jgi:hypothetical protein